MGIYWPEDRVDDVFGQACPPLNAIEVCQEANRLIEAYIDENPDADDFELKDFSSKLWEDVCLKDRIGNIDVIWKD